MCTYLQRAPNGVYYFRMGIPAELQPFMGGKLEIKVSLRLKDRDAAKAVIPDHTKAALGLLEQARREMAAANAPAPKPVPAKSPAQLRRERERAADQEWQAEQASADMDALDNEIDVLGPIMDALSEGIEPVGSPAEIARAGRLLVLHEREKAEIDQQAALSGMYARYGENRHASAEPNQAAANVPAKQGKGIYLDTDILEGWAAERKPEKKTKAIYASTAKLLNSLIGRKSAELLTKSDMLAFKRNLIEEGRSPFNVWDKLGKTRTLLDWAAQNDMIPDNPAKDVRMKKEKSEKREDWTVTALNRLLAGPVHAKRELPKGRWPGAKQPIGFRCSQSSWERAGKSLVSYSSPM